MSPVPVDLPLSEDGDDNRRPSPSVRLSITLAVHADDGVIRAAGDLDTAGGKQLHTAAEQLIKAACQRIVLDLSAVTSADLPGVRALAELGKMLERAGIGLTIRNANAAMYPVDWQAIPHSHEYEPHARRP
jgi:anti-anti-sigma factor